MNRLERMKEIMKASPNFGKGVGYKMCMVDEFEKVNAELKGIGKTAYIKGIRTMANALKKYDREEGAWTDYFEHTVDKVLKNLLKEE